VVEGYGEFQVLALGYPKKLSTASCDEATKVAFPSQIEPKPAFQSLSETQKKPDFTPEIKNQLKTSPA
jgi:hypothetical protein